LASPVSNASRLLLVTNRLVTGGSEQMLITLARSLDRRRVVPVVACLKQGGPLVGRLSEAGIAVHADLLRHKADVLVIDRLVRLFRRERIDVVCAVGSGGDRMFWSALAARYAGRACVVWSHVYPSPDHPGFEWANRALYRYVDRFVALGARHRRALIRMENAPAGRVQVIRNGIDVEPFDRPNLRPEARRRLDIGGEAKVAIGMVANLRPDKRHDVFIEAAGRLAKRYPQVVFYLIGGGPEEQTVQRLANRSGLGRDRLRLMGERNDMDVLMQGLDIVCLCSEWQECLSIVMLEAMAAGRAFVGPAIGSLDEALIDGETGRFVRPADPTSLARVLAELIGNPDQRSALGARARAKVLGEFRAKQMARAFEELTLSLSRRSGGALRVTRAS